MGLSKAIQLHVLRYTIYDPMGHLRMDINAPSRAYRITKKSKGFKSLALCEAQFSLITGTLLSEPS